METIIQIMKKYDFSEMETRVYTTLLEKGNLTGYEVSKISGVPRSKSSPDSCVKCYTMFLPFLLIKIDVFS